MVRDMKERWKYVPGFEKRYSISNMGSIQSHCMAEKKLKAIRVEKHGYCRAQLWDLENKKWKKFLVHRAVWAAFKAGNFSFKEINHIDGNKLNNCLTNLEVSNRSNNLKHAFKLGLIRPMRGSDNPKAKYSETQVKAIIAQRKAGVSRSEIVNRMGLPLTFIKSVLSNRSWKHVPRE